MSRLKAALVITAEQPTVPFPARSNGEKNERQERDREREIEIEREK